jgi:hypothetical protein
LDYATHGPFIGYTVVGAVLSILFSVSPAVFLFLLLSIGLWLRPEPWAPPTERFRGTGFSTPCYLLCRWSGWSRSGIFDIRSGGSLCVVAGDRVPRVFRSDGLHPKLRTAMASASVPFAKHYWLGSRTGWGIDGSWGGMRERVLQHFALYPHKSLIQRDFVPGCPRILRPSPKQPRWHPALADVTRLTPRGIAVPVPGFVPLTGSLTSGLRVK